MSHRSRRIACAVGTVLAGLVVAPAGGEAAPPPAPSQQVRASVAMDCGLVGPVTFDVSATLPTELRGERAFAITAITVGVAELGLLPADAVTLRLAVSGGTPATANIPADGGAYLVGDWAPRRNVTLDLTGISVLSADNAESADHCTAAEPARLATLRVKHGTPRAVETLTVTQRSALACRRYPGGYPFPSWSDLTVGLPSVVHADEPFTITGLAGRFTISGAEGNEDGTYTATPGTPAGDHVVITYNGWSNQLPWPPVGTNCEPWAGPQLVAAVAVVD